MVQFLWVAFAWWELKLLLYLDDIFQRLQLYFFQNVIHFQRLQRGLLLQPFQLQLNLPFYWLELVVLELLKQVLVFGVNYFFDNSCLLIVGVVVLVVIFVAVGLKLVEWMRLGDEVVFNEGVVVGRGDGWAVRVAVAHEVVLLWL